MGKKEKFFGMPGVHPHRCLGSSTLSHKTFPLSTSYSCSRSLPLSSSLLSLTHSLPLFSYTLSPSLSLYILLSPLFFLLHAAVMRSVIHQARSSKGSSTQIMSPTQIMSLCDFRPGANTLSGNVVRLLVSSLVEKQAYDRDHFLDLYINFMLSKTSQSSFESWNFQNSPPVSLPASFSLCKNSEKDARFGTLHSNPKTETPFLSLSANPDKDVHIDAIHVEFFERYAGNT